MDQILAAYRKSSKQWSSTMNKLADGTTFHLIVFKIKIFSSRNSTYLLTSSQLVVRQRGRKRTMVG
jgi:hypothetical protein